MIKQQTIVIAGLLFAAAAVIAVAIAVILAIKVKKYKLEIRRLIGKVNGFEISDIRAHPELIVQHLRSDGNLCDFAGQKDMASRLRGYATICEHWLDDHSRAEALRKIMGA
jgi:hypothetical protein